MNELEDRLRETLRDLAEQVESRVDMDDVRADGELLRRSRRRRMIAPGVAAAAAVALIVYGVNSQAVRAVPGPIGTVAPTITPTATPSASVTVSSTPSSAGMPRKVPAGTGGTIHFDLTKYFVMNDAKPDFEDLTITATTDAGGIAVDLVASNPGGAPVEKQAYSDGSSPVFLQLGPKLWAGLAPDDVVAMTWVDEGSIDAGFRHLNGHATALVATSDQPIDSIAGFVWRTRSGEYRDSLGNAVPSTVFTLKGRSYWYFDDVDLTLACSGLVQADPANGPSTCDNWHDGGKAGSDLWRTAGGDAVDPQSKRPLLDSYLIGLLPEGSSQLEVTLGRDASQSAQQPLAVGGRIAFIAYGRSRNEEPKLITQVRYRDASGQQVTVTR